MDADNWVAVMDEHGGLEKYLECMSQRGRSHDRKTWGDGIILEAAACLYGHPITILSRDTAAVINISNERCCDAAPLMIGIVDNCHYVSLRRSTITQTETVTAAALVVTLPPFVAPLSVDSESNTVTSATASSSQAKDNSQVCKSSDCAARDIGLYAGPCAQFALSALSDGDKVNLLERHWTPPLSYKMPYSTRTICGKEEKRYLRHEHLQRCKYLALSECRQGLFCKVCVLFGPLTAGRNPSQLNRLVTSPLTSYDRLFGANGYLTSHENAEYHKTSVVRATDFLAAMRKHTDVKTSLDTARSQQVVENRQRLKPIVSTIILCGRQNIPLRGHRDDGMLPVISDNEAGSVTNEGNFRALLQYRIESGDSVLQNHLQNTGKNASYISNTAQNGLIKSAGTVIQNKILDKVSEAKFFSLLVDETTDLSKEEQMTICLRYVSDNKIREDFIDYVSVDDMTGEGLANAILSRLRQCPIDLSCMVGQGYDGASAMSGMFNGVQAIVRKQLPAAVYVHCSSHCLNLTLSTACKLPQIRNANGIVGEVADFFSRSAKRATLFRSCVEELAPDMKRKKLVQLCETRWVERHDAIISFVQMYSSILAAVEKCELLDANTATKACMLGHSIRTPQFIVAVLVLENVLAITLPLSKALQCPTIDLIHALSNIRSVRELLQVKRGDAETTFAEVWLEATKLAEVAGTKLSVPRQSSRQQHRANIPANSPQEYFLRTLYIPFLDSVLQQLTDRFLGHNEAVCHLSAVVPSHVVTYSFQDLIPAVNAYSEFVATENEVKGEFELWQQRWRQLPAKDRPATAIDSLPLCSADFFPNIKTLLVITATLPVTTATAERTFSSLRLLKTYLRSTMGQNRLAGLTLLYLHRDIPITPDEVIDTFARHSSRRLEFVLQ